MKTIKLIEGDFSSSEATEILLDLITKKINFHNLKNMRSQVRYNKPDELSEARIKNLKAAKDQIIALAQEAKEKGSQLVIDSTLTIALVGKDLPVEICLQEELC